MLAAGPGAHDVRITGHRGLLGAIVAIAVLVAAPVASAADQFGPPPGAQYTFSSSAGTPNLIAPGTREEFAAVGTDGPPAVT
jgi:hypothetical protein